MTQRELMEKILSDPAYKGKHIVVVGESVYTANTGDGAGRILERIRQKQPEAVPAVTYIPDADTQIFYTSGIGGTEKVFLLPHIEVELGPLKRNIPVGFLDRNEVPPLMGRHLFLETLETYFSSTHITHFSDKPFAAN